MNCIAVIRRCANYHACGYRYRYRSTIIITRAVESGKKEHIVNIHNLLHDRGRPEQEVPEPFRFSGLGCGRANINKELHVAKGHNNNNNVLFSAHCLYSRNNQPREQKCFRTNKKHNTNTSLLRFCSFLPFRPMLERFLFLNS